MFNKSEKSKPKLLMLAHCLPNAIGDNQAVRAWQMLKIACKTHRVFLVCIDNSSIHISRWRTLSQMTEKLVVEKTNAFDDIFSKTLRFLNAPAAERKRLAETARQLVESLNVKKPFESLLCTHPALLSKQLKTGADTIICDLAKPKSIEHLLKSHTASMLTQWWHKIQSKLYLAAETLATTYSDIITLEDDDHWQKSNEYDCHTVVIPQRIDANEFNNTQLPMTNKSVRKLLLHADFNNRQTRREIAWFKRNVWPQIKLRVKNAQLITTNPRSTPDTADAIDNATIIVNPSTTPQAAHLPILQAMASGKPVVAAAAGAEGLNLQTGLHLQLAWSVNDWTNLCIDLLTSDTMRQQLAEQGSKLVKQNHCIESQESNLLKIPDIVVKPIQTLANAA